MTEKETPRGFERDADGVLCWGAGKGRVNYCDPGEAVKCWWAGERVFRCTERSFSHYSSHPCGHQAKYDPDANGNPTKCGHHRAAAKKRKAEAAEAKRAAREAEDRRRWLRRKAAAERQALKDEAVTLIQRIAEGHNDPRSACQDWLDRFSAIKDPE